MYVCNTKYGAYSHASVIKKQVVVDLSSMISKEMWRIIIAIILQYYYKNKRGLCHCTFSKVLESVNTNETVIHSWSHNTLFLKQGREQIIEE